MLRYGGYPEAWTSGRPERVLKNLVTAFVLRDAADRFRTGFGSNDRMHFAACSAWRPDRSETWSTTPSGRVFSVSPSRPRPSTPRCARVVVAIPGPLFGWERHRTSILRYHRCGGLRGLLGKHHDRRAASAPEGLGVVHLFGGGRRRHEATGRGGPRDVAVPVHPGVEKRGKCLRSVVDALRSAAVLVRRARKVDSVSPVAGSWVAAGTGSSREASKPRVSLRNCASRLS